MALLDPLLTTSTCPGWIDAAQPPERKSLSFKAIVVSAYGDLQNIRTAMNSGAFDFITKPIDFQDLETRSTKHCPN
jgi:YesN/AraC family two-component response regulator